MGNWQIVIRGNGIHHNGRRDDADAIVRDAVASLLAVDGTTVDEATLTITDSSYAVPSNPDVTDLLPDPPCS